MHDDREKLRHSIIVTILAAYFVPILSLAFFSISFMSFSDRWLVFSISLMIATVGSLLLILSFLRWEFLSRIPMPLPVPLVREKPVSQANDELLHAQTLLKRAKRREEDLVLKLDQAKQKWHGNKTKYDQLEKQYEKVQAEHMSLLHHSQEQLRKKDLLLTEYAQTVNDLRATMESKQDQIEKLQDSVSDLSYDLDTLLKLSDFESVEDAQQLQEQPASPPAAPKHLDRASASQQLKKCVNMAQKLTSNQFTASSRFRDLSMDNTALDQRRLFESFRSETSCVIIIYSMKEGEVLFANDMTKQVLGWSPEKFVQDFPQLIQQGAEEWKNALSSLSHQSEAQVQLLMRTKSEEAAALDCCLALIPTGAFKNHAIGVLYES